MTQQGKIIRIAKAVRPHAIRTLYLVFILSFLLPYVDVMGCSTKKIITYHGYELISGNPVSLYLLSIGIFITLFISSFYKKERSPALKAFASCWRALMAAFSGFIVGFLPGLQFLFDGVFMRIGQFLGLICAAAVFIDGMVNSIRDYPVLRKDREATAGAGQTRSTALIRFHIGIIIFSLAMVPAYSIGLRNNILTPLLFFLFLSLPFVLSQCIVIEGVRRGERWTRRWAVAVTILLAGVLVLTVLSYT